MGSAILGRLLEIAIARGQQSLTLITYADIPWNGPFYARSGCSEIGPCGAPGHLRRLLGGDRSALPASTSVFFHWPTGDAPAVEGG